MLDHLPTEVEPPNLTWRCPADMAPSDAGHEDGAA
jgi:hypothetical protein